MRRWDPAILEKISGVCARRNRCHLSSILTEPRYQHLFFPSAHTCSHLLALEIPRTAHGPALPFEQAGISINLSSFRLGRRELFSLSRALELCLEKATPSVRAHELRRLGKHAHFTCGYQRGGNHASYYKNFRPFALSPEPRRAAGLTKSRAWRWHKFRARYACVVELVSKMQIQMQMRVFT